MRHTLSLHTCISLVEIDGARKQTSHLTNELAIVSPRTAPAPNRHRAKHFLGHMSPSRKNREETIRVSLLLFLVVVDNRFVSERMWLGRSKFLSFSKTTSYENRFISPSTSGVDVDAAHLAWLQDDWALTQVQFFVCAVGWLMRLLIQLCPVLLVARDGAFVIRIFCHPHCQRSERSSNGDAIYDYMVDWQEVFRFHREPRKVAK